MVLFSSPSSRTGSMDICVLWMAVVSQAGVKCSWQENASSHIWSSFSYISIIDQHGIFTEAWQL